MAYFRHVILWSSISDIISTLLKATLKNSSSFLPLSYMRPATYYYDSKLSRARRTWDFMQGFCFSNGLSDSEFYSFQVPFPSVNIIYWTHIQQRNYSRLITTRHCTCQNLTAVVDPESCVEGGLEGFFSTFSLWIHLCSEGPMKNKFKRRFISSDQRYNTVSNLGPCLPV